MSNDYVTAIEELSEEQKSRRVIAQYQALLDQMHDVSAPSNFFKPLSNSGVTYQKAQSNNSVNQNQPTLLSSKKPTALGYEIAKAISENEDAIADVVGIILKNIKVDNKKLIELSKEEQEKINKHIEMLSTKYNIDVVKGVLSASSVATAIVFGAIIAPHATVGYAMIVNGVASLIGNEILPRTNAFEYLASFFTSDEQKQKDAASYMKIVTYLATTATSLANSLSLNPSLTSYLTSESIGKTIESATQIGSGIVSFAANMTSRELKLMEVDQTENKKELNARQFDYDSHSNNLKNTTKLSEDFIESSRYAIQLITEMNKKATDNLKK